MAKKNKEHFCRISAAGRGLGEAWERPGRGLGEAWERPGRGLGVGCLGAVRPSARLANNAAKNRQRPV